MLSEYGANDMQSVAREMVGELHLMNMRSFITSPRLNKGAALGPAATKAWAAVDCEGLVCKRRAWQGLSAPDRLLGFFLCLTVPWAVREEATRAGAAAAGPTLIKICLLHLIRVSFGCVLE